MAVKIISNGRKNMYDVIIIGGGVIGCLIARELSRYKIKIAVLEKENDISNGTTKANSAIIHAGYDAKIGTLKAKFNVEGNAMMDKVCKELGVPFKRIGSLVLAFNEEELEIIENIYENGLKNNIPNMELLNQECVKKIEPNLSDSVLGALYAKTGGIIGPWELAIAALENAIDNGVELFLNNKVEKINAGESHFVITTNEKEYNSKYVINCAGVFADEIHKMVAKLNYKITARKGEYYLLDKSAGDTVKHIVFQCPNDLGKGVVVLPTVHGNLLVGPDANFIEDKLDVSTTEENMNYVRKTASKSTESIPFKSVITSFSGLRATSNTGDFIIKEVEDVEGFFDVAGIESPGLSASPAIAKHVADMVVKKNQSIVENPKFNPLRRQNTVFMELSDEEKNDLILKDSRYGRIICRCENITEGEIVDAIHRNAGAMTIDGIKRRVRPGSGRCQGGFCAPKVMEILARELGIDFTEVVKDSLNSDIAIGKTK